MNFELKHRILIEIFISIFLLVFYALLHVYSDDYVIVPIFSSADPVFFPKTVSLCIVVFSALLVFESCSMWINFKKDKITHQMRMLMADHEDNPLLKTVLYVAVLFLYLIGLHYFGFIYTTPVIIILVALLLGLKNVFIGALLSIVFTLALDYASLRFLQIMLPQGTLFS